MSATETRQAIESILMVADSPVEPSVLAQLLEVPKADVEALCDELAAEYEAAGRGFILARVAGGYRFQSHPDLAPYVERFVLDGQTSRLSSAALETLAIVAYKQPISRMQIAAIRGVNVDGVLRTLQQRGYVDEISRDSGPGNAVLFGTTDMFLERVGLNSTADLPPLAEFVPGADVVEALEDGLRPDPLEPPAPAEATDEGEDAAEMVEPEETAEAQGTDSPDLDVEPGDVVESETADSPDDGDVDADSAPDVAVEDVAVEEAAMELAQDDIPEERAAEDVAVEDVAVEEADVAAVEDGVVDDAVELHELAVGDDIESVEVLPAERSSDDVSQIDPADPESDDVESDDPDADAVADEGQMDDDVDAGVEAEVSQTPDPGQPSPSMAEADIVDVGTIVEVDVHADLDEVIDLVAEENSDAAAVEEAIERPTELEEELAAIDALAADLAGADIDEMPTWSPAESSVVTTVRHDDPPEAEPAAPFRSAPGGLGGAGTKDGASGQDLATGEDLGAGEASPLTGSDARDD